MEFGALLSRGGPVVVVLLGLSLTALVVAIAKLQQFARARLWRRAWVDQALAHAARGDEAGALALASARPGPLARVLETALRGRLDSALSEAHLREEIERVGNRELGGLQSHLRALEVIGTLAPLLGLLGTVMGMIAAFTQLEAAGPRVDPALLSGGISEALLTTAVGLGVAIPAMAALSWFESQLDHARAAMGDAVTQLLVARPRRAHTRGEASAAAPAKAAEGAAAAAPNAL